MTEIILGEIVIDPILKAQAFLVSAINEARSNLEKAGAIQAFEICYELSWKTMKRNLTTYVYNLNIAEEVFSFLPLFAAELDLFIIKIRLM
jgi:hypothetical protein